MPIAPNNGNNARGHQLEVLFSGLNNLSDADESVEPRHINGDSMF